MSIGEKIKELRKNKGYSQEIVAEKLNVSRQAVSKWENNISIPSTENLIQLSTLFEISLEALMDENLVKDKEEKDNESIKYFQSKEDKMRVLSYLSRLGIIISLTGYYGYYLPSDDAPLFHWIILFLLSSGLIFYSNKRYYSKKNANKTLLVWDILLTFVVVFIPRILNFSIGWNIFIMHGLSLIILLFIMDLIKKRWPLNKS